MRKRHRYVTVIVNGDTGRTLAMVEHRNAAALSAFLMQQGHRWCKGVKVVVSDGSRAYKAAIDAHLGHSRHVLDRFHVIRWFSAGLTQVRRDIQRREPHGIKPAFDPEVFRARFSLLRRGDTLTDADRARLDTLFDAHPACGPAGRPSRSCSASTSPTTTKAPSMPSDGSATSTRPVSCPSTTTSSTPSSHGQTRSSPGTTPAGPPTGRIEGTNNLLQVLRRSGLAPCANGGGGGSAGEVASKWRPGLREVGVADGARAVARGVPGLDIESPEPTDRCQPRWIRAELPFERQ